MADDIESTVLNTTGEEAGGVSLVDADNPVNWKRLAQLLVGSLLSLVYASTFGLMESATQLVVGLWDAAGSFLSDVFTALGTQGDRAFSTAAESTAGAIEFLPVGIRWAAAVGVVLLSLYIATQGLEVIRSG